MAAAYLAVLSPVVVFFTLLIPIAVGQAVRLSASLPELAEDAPRLLDRVQSIATSFGFDVDLSGIYETEFVSQAGRIVGEWLLANSFSIAQTTVGTLFQAFIIATLSVYIVLEGERLSTVILRVVPQQMHDEVRFVYATMDRIFEQWLRGVVIIGGIFAATTFVVMSIAGLPYAVVFSLAAGVLVIIPFIGDFIAIGLPVTAALLDGSFLEAAIVGGVLVGIDVLVLNLFVSPRVLGQAVRLPTVLVILGVLLGAKLAGPWGALLGVPVAGLVYSSVIAFADRAQGRTDQLIEPTEVESDEASAPVK